MVGMAKTAWLMYGNPYIFKYIMEKTPSLSIMVPAKPVRNYSTPQSSIWENFIRRIFETDPLIYTKCWKRMCIIAFIPNSSDAAKIL